MKINPVYRRETKVSTRSFRLALIILVFNGILSVVALLNMYSVIEQVKITAEIQYSSFLEMYMFVAAIEFVLLMFIVPAITSGSISGERERQTLDLMLTTKMTPAQIVIGKLGASISTMFLLIFSSCPVLALVFVYGGGMVSDILMLFLCYVAVALLAGSLGVCMSAIFKRSTLATVVSYGILIVVAAGTYAVNAFVLAMARMNMASYANTIGSVTQQANSGGFLYLLLLNPAVTFYAAINKQAGNNQAVNNITQWFGAHSANFITQNWIYISIGVQLAIAGILVLVAIKAISPKKRGNKQRRRKE
ncbi:ABC transporter permease subunit [Clostridium sp. MCC353]|uniref:ABC transporter permease n=1 Tax=Clostridium sp. MCC353 TaxID=2592646 RepID=UPI001C023949|nr:ABC transporter permease subunit [Clostridium sp. MCC353]MBT9777755.1 ABC transporter permease subunit [Clostridium sp. MCC353]